MTEKKLEVELKWPESCIYYAGSVNKGAQKRHKCDHKMGTEGSCIPVYCPIKKYDKLCDELENFREQLKTAEGEDVGWLRDQIEWYVKKIAEYEEVI